MCQMQSILSIGVWTCPLSFRAADHCLYVRLRAACQIFSGKSFFFYPLSWRERASFCPIWNPHVDLCALFQRLLFQNYITAVDVQCSMFFVHSRKINVFGLYSSLIFLFIGVKGKIYLYTKFDMGLTSVTTLTKPRSCYQKRKTA